VSGIPQQPYFLRALYEWCVDSGYTPHLAVRVDHRCKVPQGGFVRNGQIVLNIGPSAVRNMHMDNEWITFSARFGGISHSIEVPTANVLSIYAKETGEGMGFAEAGQDMGASASDQQTDLEAAPASSADAPDEPPEPPRGRPKLRVVK
jgi:stringent starvation protein B